MISIKTKSEIDLMRTAGEIVALVLKKIEENISPGVKPLNLTELLKNPSEAKGLYLPLKDIKLHMLILMISREVYVHQ